MYLTTGLYLLGAVMSFQLSRRILTSKEFDKDYDISIQIVAALAWPLVTIYFSIKGEK